MGKPELSLFYHPTLAVYIDDNKEFIQSVTMKSEPGSFALFDDPHEGLVYVEAQNKLIENFAKGLPMSPDINTPQQLVLPQNHICKKLNTLNRFAEPSVVVVDFSMPNLNGLDLCSQITNPNTKKILLTGVANEKQAIHALNSDLIDFYIGKNEDDLPNRLKAIIATLNKRYFMELMPLSKQAAYSQIPYLFDTEFADYFEQLCEDLDVVEYYYVTNPGGFLLIDRFGAMSRLLVYTNDEFSNTLVDLQEKKVSQECYNVLANRTQAPFFQDDDGEFQASFMQNWQEHIYPIDLIHGEQEFFCALIKKKFRCLSSFQEYLDMPSNRLH